MPLTALDLVGTLLDYIDVHDGNPATPAQYRAAANAINGAAQEIFTEGPAHVRRREFSTQVNGPKAVTFGASQGSTSISGFTQFQPWMSGCSIRMAGEAYDNEIVDARTLLQPYQGPDSAAASGTVYADAINAPAGVVGVLNQPRLADIRTLTPAPSRDAFNKANYWHEGDYGEAVLTIQARRKWVGQPHTFWVDTVYLPTPPAGTEPGIGESLYQPDPHPAQPAIRIRLAPYPDGAYVLKYDAEVAPPLVTAGMLADPAAAGAFVFQLPGNFTEGMLLPFALQRWTGSPWFKNEEALAEIGRQYKVAYKALYGSRPQRARARMIVPRI